ncbi:helix-turn-helix domain-containing protein [Streptomyces sp. NPDC012421]|uniref:helix-turn-helix domain-containing protein n=1 Tax=Streptomyces sp. NPDC012421 TaxID=3364832 RepID=UPI0036E72653
MTDSTLSLAARLAAEPDPARAFHLALAAAEAAAAPFEDAANQAVTALVAQHGDNVAAAARELGLTPQALHKRLKKIAEGGTARPVPAAAVQPQPALAFESPQFAVEALANWALRQGEIDDQRDVFLLGALAAGVDPVVIAETTRVGLDTLRRIRPAGNITVSRLDPFGPEIEEFGRAVRARAQALAASADSPEEHAAATVWRFASRAIIANAAPLATMSDDWLKADDYASEEEYAAAVLAHEPSEAEKETDAQPVDELTQVDGADAWLASTWVTYQRLAASRDSDSDDDPRFAGSRRAFGELADAILHLRTTGTVPAGLLGATS